MKISLTQLFKCIFYKLIKMSKHFKSILTKNNMNISTDVKPSIKSEAKSNPSSVRKRKDLSMIEKLEILKHYDRLPKMSQRSAAVRLNISQPVLGKILKNRNFIENMPKNRNCIRKRARGGKEKEIESALKLWYVEVGKRNIPISGNLIRAKAKELGRQMGKEFGATCGWLTRWKKRENIVCNTILRRKITDGAEFNSLEHEKMDSERSENISGTNTSLGITGEKCRFSESSPGNSSVSYNINPVMEILEEPNIEIDKEHMCDVFIKMESDYEYKSDKQQPAATPPTDEEMLEALTVLSVGVKHRTSNLKLHFEYESFIKQLLKGFV